MLPTYKIMPVGDSKVGKTAIKRRLCNGQYTDEYVPTTEFTNGMKHNLLVDGSLVDVIVWDTPDKSKEDLFLDGFPRIGHTIDAVLFVFDIGNRNSFDQVQRHVPRMKQLYKNLPDKCGYVDPREWTKEPMFMLVGNKCDLADDARQVSTEEAQGYARSFNLPFMEVSARSNINIDAAFVALVKAVNEKREEEMDRNRGDGGWLKWIPVLGTIITATGQIIVTVIRAIRK